MFIFIYNNFNEMFVLGYDFSNNFNIGVKSSLLFLLPIFLEIVEYWVKLISCINIFVYNFWAQSYKANKVKRLRISKFIIVELKAGIKINRILATM